MRQTPSVSDHLCLQWRCSCQLLVIPERKWWGDFPSWTSYNSRMLCLLSASDVRDWPCDLDARRPLLYGQVFLKPILLIWRLTKQVLCLRQAAVDRRFDTIEDLWNRITSVGGERKAQSGALVMCTCSFMLFRDLKHHETGFLPLGTTVIDPYKTSRRRLWLDRLDGSKVRMLRLSRKASWVSRKALWFVYSHLPFGRVKPQEVHVVIFFRWFSW